MKLVATWSVTSSSTCIPGYLNVNVFPVFCKYLYCFGFFRARLYRYIKSTFLPYFILF